MAQTVVEALSAAHDVTVVCGRPSYEPTERRAWRLWQTEKPGQSFGAGNVRIIRVGSTDYSRSQMRRRVLNYLTYVALSLPRATFVPCDVVVGMTDPPFEGIVAAAVALLKGKPLVYNVRDLYPDMAMGGSIVEPGLLTKVWERLHRWALRRATRVVVLGDGKELYRSEPRTSLDEAANISLNLSGVRALVLRVESPGDVSLPAAALWADPLLVK